jgi:two-component system phosphate regulon sensor histidine kinase PhoR
MAVAKVTKSRLFWKIGFVYLLMLLLAMIVLDTYVVQALKGEYVEAAFSQLESLSSLAQQKPLQSLEASEIREWSSWMAKSGVRVTLIANDGTVLADTDENPAKMENHHGRPEVRDAFSSGSGRAVRYSATLKHDLVYVAQRFNIEGGPPLVMRFSLPVRRLDIAVAEFRGRLWSISLVILTLAGGASLLNTATMNWRTSPAV